jgi:hypothetical protein
MQHAQSIRPTQFITTFGPGSILEGPDGPRIVYDLARSNVFHNRPVSEFAIQDAGLSRIISRVTGNNAQIVRLPTNADHNVPDGNHIYETETFPKWSLCVEHSILYRRTMAHDKGTGCPLCNDLTSSYAAHVRSRREAIRFVQVCLAGHLDDVNWVRLIQHATAGCMPGHLRWHGSGGSLNAVEIECPDCRARVNLGQAYGRDLRCTGCHPERGELNQGMRAGLPQCTQVAHMMQRGATFIYTPEHLSAITIPSLDTELHQLMASSQKLLALQTLDDLTGGAFDANAVRRAMSPPRAPDPHADIILNRYEPEVIVRTATEVLSHRFPETEAELRLNEFIQLQRAATHGHPSQRSTTPGAPPLFEVIAGDVRQDLHWPGRPHGARFRVAPISRLRVVMAQLAYRRMNGPTQVSVHFTDNADTWYPGVELYGEGVFVDLAPASGQESAANHPLMASEDAETWLASYQQDRNVERHPVFVWWHTLAHRLILALSVDSGYSSASIRERVYTSVDPQSGNAVGGVLLYTVQPGGDGTLGGLIAQVPHFERVLRGALDRIDSCSNDPLCGEEKFALDRPNGAVCYACGLVSETSCEFRNMYLDRNLLRKHPA